MLKQIEKLGQRAREDFKTLTTPWYKSQNYTKRKTPGPGKHKSMLVNCIK